MVLAAEQVARTSYGRLLAILAARTRDIAGAEDALADALVAALFQWPSEGVPNNPDAWLLTTARRRLLDGHRQQAVRQRAQENVTFVMEELMQVSSDALFRDDRLRLLFVCTHPAIAADAQVPLMLQTVLGLDADAIASALCVAPKTMGQRLWRAKTKIKETQISFEVPDKTQLPERIDAVLEAIYAAFGTAWEDVDGTDSKSRDLTKEAIFLGQLLVSLMPNAAEAHGLLSLMFFSNSRRHARRNNIGDYVPLEAQNTALWDLKMIDHAEDLLMQAVSLKQLGPFQIEASLQSAHIHGVRRGQIDYEGIVHLYDGLLIMAPSLGAEVGRAAALIKARGPEAALFALDQIDAGQAETYQPYWAVRAAAHQSCGQVQDAHAMYLRAVGMTEDQALRRFLLDKAQACLR